MVMNSRQSDLNNVTKNVALQHYEKDQTSGGKV